MQRYAMRLEDIQAEIIEKKDPMKQLEASKSSIKDLLSDLLNDTKPYVKKIQVKWRN